MNINDFRVCVVGSGFFGATIAERVSSELNLPVLVIEKRSHTGGNSHSEIDLETGVECHSYGSHIFHTSDKKIWDYANRFANFNSYRHRVFTKYDNKVYNMPINLNTVNQFYGEGLDPQGAREFLAREIARDRVEDPSCFEDKAISLIGRPLYEAFVQGYSEKQWETDLRKLPASIINRLPVRFDYNDRYFDDTYEGIPTDGYAALFRRMLESPLIDVRLNTDYFAFRDQIPADCLVVYTGPVDRFFNYKHGRLSWRTLDFDREVHDVDDYQGTSVMNYADRANPYTRTHEFKHYHPERKITSGKTTVFHERSRFAFGNDEPYYPVNTAEDRERMGLYRQEMAKCSNVVFGGRLATYKYLDMHQVIGQALSCYENEIKPRLTGGK